MTASFHVVASIPLFLIHESYDDELWGRIIRRSWTKSDDGQVSLPQGTGLCLEIDEGALASAAKDPAKLKLSSANVLIVGAGDGSPIYSKNAESVTPIASGPHLRSATALSTPPLRATATRPDAGRERKIGPRALASASREPSSRLFVVATSTRSRLLRRQFTRCLFNMYASRR